MSTFQNSNLNRNGSLFTMHYNFSEYNKGTNVMPLDASELHREHYQGELPVAKRDRQGLLHNYDFIGLNIVVVICNCIPLSCFNLKPIKSSYLCQSTTYQMLFLSH